jgi:hypothetical protein
MVEVQAPSELTTQSNSISQNIQIVTRRFIFKKKRTNVNNEKKDNHTVFIGQYIL